MRVSMQVYEIAAHVGRVYHRADTSFLQYVLCYTFPMKYVIGIDEVGRGPIAGPVAVGAFVFRTPASEKLLQKHIKTASVPLRDSKKLTRLQREKWFTHIQEWQKEKLCDFHVCMVSPAQIDAKGISYCIKYALAQSLKKIQARETDLILLDGGLKAPPNFLKQKTIIKGDEKETVIALASIMAKVTRDRYMVRIAKQYPQYGFEQHVGYGTRKHYEALEQYGLSTVHRLSFLKNL